jgi:cytochrome c oxidase cbb3-type subunit 1
MVSIGALYHLVTRLWHTEIFSAKLVNLHFWMATIGAVIYITAMWVSGIMQGLMWRAYDDYGTLAYTFAESVSAMHPYYVMRAFGGLIFFLGGVVMLFNVIMTVRKGSPVSTTSAATASA